MKILLRNEAKYLGERKKFVSLLTLSKPQRKKKKFMKMKRYFHTKVFIELISNEQAVKRECAVDTVVKNQY